MATKKKARRGMLRQGDVLLVPVDGVDEAWLELAPADARGIVLAEGETSGHYHRLYGSGRLMRYRDERQTDRVLFVADGGGVLRVDGDVTRHTPVDVPPGAYRVRIQRSWSLEEERAHAVQD